MAIQAPKEKPAIQHRSAPGFCICSQSSTEAASLSSPCPWSYSPCERPTPREVEAYDRERLPAEGVIERVDDLVVHGAAVLRVRMQHQRDGRARVLGLLVARLQAALGAR